MHDPDPPFRPIHRADGYLSPDDCGLIDPATGVLETELRCATGVVRSWLDGCDYAEGATR
ncbi:Uncharacterised protein [Nocardia africana]|uniref:Uncharacterized protein n=1 Tax=Nocardia africana TaxID=134964 RepID=A0A378WWJ8_9NOCA|nr:Uncharacterised protein [Nocardia africana]